MKEGGYLIRVLLSLVLYITVSNLYATNYYVDPNIGLPSNDGSIGSPWRTLEEVFNTFPTFSGGDTIFLYSGNHGFPKINGDNVGHVTIMPFENEIPVLDRLYVGSTSNTSYWVFKGLKVGTINVVAFPQPNISLFLISHHITIENCTISSVDNTAGYTRNDWRTNMNHGIRALGSNYIIKNNDITNVAVGLSIESDSTKVIGNKIKYFTTDGIRGLGDNCLYKGNFVRDPMTVFTYAENHYDAFQSYTCCFDGSDTIKNVTIENNIFYNYHDPLNPYPGPMQGIACFDGYYDSWVIKNNIVSVDHWHGITLLGALNCRIINNTIIDLYANTPPDPLDTARLLSYGPSWIRISPHKNGGVSHNNEIINNICNSLVSTPLETQTFNNIQLLEALYNTTFEDPTNFNLHLKSTSFAVDSGIVVPSNSNDIEQNSRPNGVLFDVGAFEFYSLNIQSVNVSDCSLDNGIPKFSLTINLSWSDPLPNKKLEIRIGNKFQIIDIPGGATSPSQVVFELDADGVANRVVEVYFQGAPIVDTKTSMFDAPPPCCPLPYEKCPGESFTLTAQAGLSNYQWLKNDGTGLFVNVNGETNMVFNTSDIGEYKWKAEDFMGCNVELCCPVEIILGTNCCMLNMPIALTQCNNNGTLGDPSDDTFMYYINVTGTGTGTSTYSISGSDSQSQLTYGVNNGPFGPFNIASGNLVLTITDDTDVTCQLTPVSIMPPLSCSSCGNSICLPVSITPN